MQPPVPVIFSDNVRIKQGNISGQRGGYVMCGIYQDKQHLNKASVLPQLFHCHFQRTQCRGTDIRAVGVAKKTARLPYHDNPKV